MATDLEKERKNLKEEIHQAQRVNAVINVKLESSLEIEKTLSKRLEKSEQRVKGILYNIKLIQSALDKKVVLENLADLEFSVYNMILENSLDVKRDVIQSDEDNDEEIDKEGEIVEEEKIDPNELAEVIKNLKNERDKIMKEGDNLSKRLQNSGDNQFKSSLQIRKNIEIFNQLETTYGKLLIEYQSFVKGVKREEVATSGSKVASAAASEPAAGAAPVSTKPAVPQAAQQELQGAGTAPPVAPSPGPPKAEPIPVASPLDDPPTVESGGSIPEAPPMDGPPSGAPFDAPPLGPPPTPPPSDAASSGVSTPALKKASPPKPPAGQALGEDHLAAIRAKAKAREEKSKLKQSQPFETVSLPELVIDQKGFEEFIGRNLISNAKHNIKLMELINDKSFSTKPEDEFDEKFVKKLNAADNEKLMAFYKEVVTAEQKEKMADKATKAAVPKVSPVTAAAKLAAAKAKTAPAEKHTAPPTPPTVAVEPSAANEGAKVEAAEKATSGTSVAVPEPEARAAAEAEAEAVPPPPEESETSEVQESEAQSEASSEIPPPPEEPPEEEETEAPPPPSDEPESSEPEVANVPPPAPPLKSDKLPEAPAPASKVAVPETSPAAAAPQPAPAPAAAADVGTQKSEKPVMKPDLLASIQGFKKKKLKRVEGMPAPAPAGASPAVVSTAAAAPKTLPIAPAPQPAPASSATPAPPPVAPTPSQPPATLPLAAASPSAAPAKQPAAAPAISAAPAKPLAAAATAAASAKPLAAKPTPSAAASSSSEAGPAAPQASPPSYEDLMELQRDQVAPPVLTTGVGLNERLTAATGELGGKRTVNAGEAQWSGLRSPKVGTSSQEFPGAVSASSTSNITPETIQASFEEIKTKIKQGDSLYKHALITGKADDFTVAIPRRDQSARREDTITRKVDKNNVTIKLSRHAEENTFHLFCDTGANFSPLSMNKACGDELVILKLMEAAMVNGKLTINLHPDDQRLLEESSSSQVKGYYKFLSDPSANREKFLKVREEELAASEIRPLGVPPKSLQLSNLEPRPSRP